MDIRQLLNEYASSHQNSINIFIHKICVPLILFSIIGLLISTDVTIFKVPLVFFVSLVVMIYYFYLSLKYALLILPVIILMIYGNFYLAIHSNLFYVSTIIFIISWIFQFIGHKIEGKKPSFFKDLQFLLIGPLWVIKSLFAIKD